MNYFDIRNYHDKRIRHLQAQIDSRLVQRETIDCELDTLARELESEREAQSLLFIDRDILPVVSPITILEFETV